MKTNIDQRFLSVMKIVAIRCEPAEVKAIGHSLANLFAELRLLKMKYDKLETISNEVLDNSKTVLRSTAYKAMSPVITLIIGLIVGYYMR